LRTDELRADELWTHEGRRRAVATLELSGSRDLVGRLASQTQVRLSLVRASAEEGDDGLWSVIAYADEDQVPALEAQGYTVRVVTSDATLLARWDDIDAGPPVA
jgi:hypothetical protein